MGSSFSTPHPHLNLNLLTRTTRRIDGIYGYYWKQGNDLALEELVARGVLDAKVLENWKQEGAEGWRLDGQMGCWVWRKD